MSRKYYRRSSENGGKNGGSPRGSGSSVSELTVTTELEDLCAPATGDEEEVPNS